MSDYLAGWRAAREAIDALCTEHPYYSGFSIRRLVRALPDPAPPPAPPLEQRLWAVIDRHGVKELPSDIVEAVARLAAGWRPPQPAPAVIERARRLAAETPPHPFSGTNNCERHEFARALLAVVARAEAAEAERDEASMKLRAAKDALRNQEIIAEGDKEAWRKAILADRARAEAAEAERGRLRARLAIAGEQFRYYEGQHIKKGNAGKAATDAAFANLCEHAALTPATEASDDR